MGRKKRKLPPPAFATALPHQGFVQMFNDQLNTPAFISLSPVAKVMYLILRQEFKGYYMDDNNITCPYSTFTEKGISRNSIPDNLRMLEAMGFISCEHGGLYHTPNLYHFTTDWKKIQTLEEAKAIKAQLVEEKKLKRLAQEQVSNKAS